MALTLKVFIKFAGEEDQVVKRGREYHGCMEEYNVEKRERGSNIIFPVIIGQFGRKSSGEEDGNFGEENQDLKKKWGWGRISSCRNFIHPWIEHPLPNKYE